VLIPRPETETLAEIAGEYLKSNPRGTFADWCAGSGCLAVTLLAENLDCSGYAVDISPGALEVVATNAKRHGVSERLTRIENGDPAQVTEIPAASLDMIVANPPYIPSGDVAALERQVREFEPSLALDGGDDGLDIFKILLAGLPRLMKPGAPLLFETGGGGQPELIAELGGRNLTLEKIIPDHRGIERFMIWRRTV
jgi:release factor glutamine methyltransferase